MSRHLAIDAFGLAVIAAASIAALLTTRVDPLALAVAAGSAAVLWLIWRARP